MLAKKSWSRAVLSSLGAVVVSASVVLAPVGASTAPVIQPVDPPTPAASGIYGVACTSTYCFGATDSGVMASTNHGATWDSWVRNTLGQNGALSIACPTDSTCLIVTGNGTLLESTDGGWTYGSINLSVAQLPATYAIAEVSCSSSGTCFIEENYSGNGKLLPSRLLVSTGQLAQSTVSHPAASWKATSFPVGLAPANTLSTSCSTTTCFSVGQNSTGSVQALLSSPVGSTTWSKVALPASTGVAVSAVSCVATSCVVTSNTSGSTFVASASKLYLTSNNGTTWTTSAGPSPAHTAAWVSLSTPTHFSVSYQDETDGSTYVSTTSDNGASWTTTHLAALGVQGANDLSCVASGSCWVWGASSSFTGELAYSVDGTSFAPQSLVNGTTEIDSTACVSASRCLFGGIDGNGAPVINVTSDGGYNYAVATVPTASGTVSKLACVGASCVAAITTTDYHIAIWTSTDAGATWSVANTNALASTTTQVTALTCPTTKQCFLGYVTINPKLSSLASFTGHIARSTDGGASWTDSTIPSNTTIISAISCPTSAICVAGGASTTQGVTTPVLLRLNASSWVSVYSSTTPGLFETVSCFSATVCDAAIGTAKRSGTAYQSLNGGATWAKASGLGTGTISGLACVTNARCMALTQSTSSKGASTSIFTTTTGTKWSAVPTNLASPAYVAQISTVVAIDASNFVFISGPTGLPAILFWRPLN
jgi:hypothetical protein